MALSGEKKRKALGILGGLQKRLERIESAKARQPQKGASTESAMTLIEEIRVPALEMLKREKPRPQN